MKFAIRHSQFAIVLRDASGWLLLAALVYAPWDYGGTTERGIVNLNWVLGAAGALWLAGKVGRWIALRGSASVSRSTRLRNAAARTAANVQRSLPEEGDEENVERRTSNVEFLEDDRRNRSRWRDHSSTIRDPQAAIGRAPVALLVLVTLLLALGWGMVANAHGIYDSDHHLFTRLSGFWPSGPGALDQAVAAAWMVRATVLLGALLIVADLSRDPRWLLRLWWTVGLVGGSIALLGLMQKASGAPMIFWEDVERPVATFFATYYYHANAGAFLNLTLPVTIGLALRSWTRPKEPLIRALWLSLALVSVVAVFSNTSRMSQLLGGAMLLVLCAALLPKAFGAARRMEWATTVAGVLAVSIALYAVVQTSRLDRSLERWEKTTARTALLERSAAPQAALRAVPDAGWFGFGPGTFHVVFPYYTGGLDDPLHGFWLFLHQDYLQTLMEWGWLGGGLMACVFFGGMAVAVANWWREAAGRKQKSASAECQRQHAKSARSPDSWTPRQRLLLPLVLLALGSVALHALVDFPLQIASIQVYVAVYLGICWGSGFWKLESRK